MVLLSVVPSVLQAECPRMQVGALIFLGLVLLDDDRIGRGEGVLPDARHLPGDLAAGEPPAILIRFPSPLQRHRGSDPGHPIGVS